MTPPCPIGPKRNTRFRRSNRCSHRPEPQTTAGFAYYILGNLPRARTSCEIRTSEAYWCLAVYSKLVRSADAQVMLAKLRAARGDEGAYEYTVIHAQWGDTARALDRLETAMRLHNPWLVQTKMNLFAEQGAA